MANLPDYLTLSTTLLSQPLVGSTQIEEDPAVMRKGQVRNISGSDIKP
jgi:hypothetical protein